MIVTKSSSISIHWKLFIIFPHLRFNEIYSILWLNSIFFVLWMNYPSGNYIKQIQEKNYSLNHKSVKLKNYLHETNFWIQELRLCSVQKIMFYVKKWWEKCQLVTVMISFTLTTMQKWYFTLKYVFLRALYNVRYL